MRLLITGAAGFMGRNMLLAIPNSWQVVALYRPGNIEFLAFLDTYQLDHVQPIVCDLTDEEQVKQTVGKVGRNFDRCIALASNTSIHYSIEQPIQDLIINVIGLLHILRHYSFEHFIYLSSGAVYVGLTNQVGPASAVSPPLPYAISKLAAEQYVCASIRHYRSPRHATIIRFFGAYGPYEPARKLYTKLVRQFAFGHNPHFTVVGDGENYIDAMYIDDAVRALMAVLTSPPIDEICHLDLGVGSGETINQVVARAAHTFGLEPQISHEGSTAEYIRFTIDPKPFQRTYKFAPMISLETGLKRLADHLAQEDYERQKNLYLKEAKQV